MEMPQSQESRLEQSGKTYKEAFLAYRDAMQNYGAKREAGEKWQEAWTKEQDELDKKREEAEKQLRFDGGNPGEVLKEVEREDEEKARGKIKESRQFEKNAREWEEMGPSR